MRLSFTILIFMFMISSCTQNTNHKLIEGNTLKDTSLLISNEAKTIQTTPLPDTLALEKVLFNGKEFFLNKIESKQDSSHLELWECGNPFEWMDKEADNDSIYHIFHKIMTYE